MKQCRLDKPPNKMLIVKQWPPSPYLVAALTQLRLQLINLHFTR